MQKIANIMYIFSNVQTINCNWSSLGVEVNVHTSKIKMVIAIQYCFAPSFSFEISLIHKCVAPGRGVIPVFRSVNQFPPVAKPFTIFEEWGHILAFNSSSIVWIHSYIIYLKYSTIIWIKRMSAKQCKNVGNNRLILLILF